MKLIIKKTSILLLITLFAICTVMGMGITAANFSAKAADLPVLATLQMTTDLDGKPLVKGSSFHVYYTFSSTIDDGSVYESFDIYLAPLTATKDAIDVASAGKMSAEIVDEEEETYFYSEDLKYPSYSDGGSDDFLRNPNQPSSASQFRMAIVYDTDKPKYAVSATATVTIEVELTVDADIAADSITLGLLTTGSKLQKKNGISFFNPTTNKSRYLYPYDYVSAGAGNASAAMLAVKGDVIDGVQTDVLVIPLIDETEDNSLASLDIGPAADALTAVDMTVEKPSYTVDAPMDQMVVKPVAGSPDCATVQVSVTEADGTTLAGAPVGLAADGTVTLSPRPSHGQKIKVTVTSQVGTPADYFVDIVVSYARLVALTSDVPPEEGTTLGFQEAIGSDGLATTFAYTLHVPTVQDVQLTPTVLANYGINEQVAVAVTGGTVTANTVNSGAAATVTMTEATTVVTLTLTAADGTTTQDYVITILSADVSITTFTVTGASTTVYDNDATQAATKSVDYYFCLMNEDEPKGTMNIVIATGATVQVDGSDYAAATVSEGGEHTVTVTAVAGNSKVYKVILTSPEVLELIDGADFDFVLLREEEAGTFRRTYREIGWKHGVDDKEIERLLLGNVDPGESLKNFVTQIKPSMLPMIRIYDNAQSLVYDRGTPAAEKADAFESGLLGVGTGYSIAFGPGETPIEMIYVTILGDGNGDGVISATDTSMLIRATKDNFPPSLEGQYAMYILNRGFINTGDVAKMKQLAKGVQPVSDFYWKPETAEAASVSNAPAFVAAPETFVVAVEEIFAETEEIAETEIVTESRLAVDMQEPIEDTTEPTESEEPVNHQPAVPSKKFGYTDWDIKEKTL